MATMQTSGAPASDLPYYVWEAPGKSIAIQLRFDAIDRMYPEIMRGLGALKKRGAEVGGILLGRSAPDSPDRVIIEDFDPVPSEYLTGPSYNLSENDRVVFEAAIARRQRNADTELSVVGFYRSHTRDELYMDDADVALAQRYFPDAGNVFLLIKPYASRTSIGGFFFWENGEIKRESSYLQFPFNRGELGGGESRPIPMPERPEQERTLPPYMPSELRSRPADFNPDEETFSLAARTSLSILSAPPEAPALTSRMPRMRWVLAVAFLALAGIAGSFAYRELAAPKGQRSNAARVETTLPLKLSVAEKQNQLDVTWDRNSPAILGARRGMLFISDGLNKRDLELSGAQLRTGRVVYSRLSADVSLRLEVFADGPDPVTESIRIVSTEPPHTVPEPITAEATVIEKPTAIAKPAVSKRAQVSTPKAELTPTPRPAMAPPPAAEAPAPEVELQRPARRR